MICTITVTRNRAGADERRSQPLSRPLVHGRGDGSALVGTVVTAAAENLLPATPIDPFPEAGVVGNRYRHGWRRRR